DRSWPRYQMLKRLWKPLLGRLSAVLAQSETDAQRLLELGCAPERVSVAGNLKFDVRVVEETDVTKLLKLLAADRPLLVAGSTIEGEEAVLLEIWPQLRAADPRLAMVLAPRHPERFSAVAALLNRSGVPWVRRSDWPIKPVYALEPLKDGEIVLLDSIGELASVYSMATVAFVGGSLYPTGGHNPLEPAQFGVPIVMGPYYANFRDLTDDLREHDAVRVTTKEELGKVLQELLANSADATSIGARAREVFQAQAGATARSIAAIREVLSRGTAA